MALVTELKTVVLDTNVLISGLISIKSKTGSVALRILKQFEGTEYLLVTTHKILEEYGEKCEEKIKERLINASDVNRWLTLIRTKSRIGSILRDPPIHVMGDPTDNIWFNSTDCLNAKYLVTGNMKHLGPIQVDLQKKGFPLIIISPSDFLRNTTGSFRKENISTGLQSAYCPVCGEGMSINMIDTCDNGKGKIYERIVFYCGIDDVWITQEIPTSC